MTQEQMNLWLQNQSEKMEQFGEAMNSLTSENKINRLLAPIKACDGRSFEAARIYTEWMEFIYSMLVGEDHSKASRIKQVFLSKLAGEALVFVYKLLQEEAHQASLPAGQPPTSWVQFKDKFKARFCDSAIDVAAQQQLRAPRQRQNAESALAYCERIDRLSKLAYPGTVRDTEVKKQLARLVIAGLNDKSLAKKIFKKQDIDSIESCKKHIVDLTADERSFNLLRNDSVGAVMSPIETHKTAVNEGQGLYSAYSNQFTPPETFSYSSFMPPQVPVTPVYPEKMEVNELHDLEPYATEQIDMDMVNKDRRHDVRPSRANELPWNEMQAQIAQISKRLDNTQITGVKKAINEINAKLDKVEKRNFDKSNAGAQRRSRENSKPSRGSSGQRPFSAPRRGERKSNEAISTRDIGDNGRKGGFNFQTGRTYNRSESSSPVRYRERPFYTSEKGQGRPMSSSGYARMNSNIKTGSPAYNRNGDRQKYNSREGSPAGSKSPVICYKCNEENHLSNDCLLKAGGRQIFCYTCDAPNHISTTCKAGPKD